jgi:hypothetical protein
MAGSNAKVGIYDPETGEEAAVEGGALSVTQADSDSDKVFTYNGDDKVETITETVGTKTKVTTFTYTDGKLTGITKVIT